MQAHQKLNLLNRWKLNHSIIILIRMKIQSKLLKSLYHNISSLKEMICKFQLIFLIKMSLEVCMYSWRKLLFIILFDTIYITIWLCSWLMDCSHNCLALCIILLVLFTLLFLTIHVTVVYCSLVVVIVHFTVWYYLLLFDY